MADRFRDGRRRSIRPADRIPDFRYEFIPPLAGALTHTPKYVASDRPAIASWGTTTVLNGDAVPEVGKIKYCVDTLMLIGRGSLAGTLAKAGLIDECRLLVQAKELDQGQSLLHYRVHKSA